MDTQIVWGKCLLCGKEVVGTHIVEKGGVVHIGCAKGLDEFRNKPKDHLSKARYIVLGLYLATCWCVHHKLGG